MSCKIIAQFGPRHVYSLTISLQREREGGGRVKWGRIINITVLPGHAHLHQQLPWLHYVYYYYLCSCELRNLLLLNFL